MTRRKKPESEADVFVVEDAVVVRATDRAVLVQITDFDEEWVPRSQLDSETTVHDVGDRGRLVVAGWFARKLGWSS